MVIELPAPAAGYFLADQGTDANAISRCFTEGATVRDEGHSCVGHAAIRRWKVASSKKYQYTAEPVAAANEGGLTVVTAHLSGDFPGRPVDLRYRFALEGDRIAGLEIGA